MQRVLAIPEAEVAACSTGCSAAFAAATAAFEALLERALRAGGPPRRPRHRRQPGAAAADRRLLHPRVLGRGGGPVQPVDRAGARTRAAAAPGKRRFVMSLRAVGEGHISSIEFRSGVHRRRRRADLRSARATRWSTGHRAAPARYDKEQFRAKLIELGADNELARPVLDRLPERFTLAELEQLAGLARGERALRTPSATRPSRSSACWPRRATSPPSRPTRQLSERVIFPAGPHETRGMEDARFVRFTDEDGSVALLRHLHRLRRLRDPAPADRDRRLPSPSASRPSTARPRRTRAWPCSPAGSAAST